MNMQVGRAEIGPGLAGVGRGNSRRVYLPTIVVAGLAAWLNWQGWAALGPTGVAWSVALSLLLTRHLLVVLGAPRL